jgi:hypothetical protein
MSEIVLVTLLMKTHKNSFCSVIWLMLLWYWLKIFRCFPYSSCFNYIWDSMWHWFYVIVSLGFVMQFQALFAEMFFFLQKCFFFLVKRDVHLFVYCYRLMRLNNLVCPFPSSSTSQSMGFYIMSITLATKPKLVCTTVVLFFSFLSYTSWKFILFFRL